MAWIRTLGEEEAEPALADLYRTVRDPKTGRLDHILTIHSLHSEGLRAHFDLYRTVMTGTKTLRKVDRELIALVTSQINECHY